MSACVGKDDIRARGSYPARLPHAALEEQDTVEVVQRYADIEGIEKEIIGPMDGSEASEWLRDFGLENMLSGQSVVKSGMLGFLGLDWNPFRPDKFRGGLNSYELQQSGGRGNLTVYVSDRAPWPWPQREELEMSWEY